MDVQDRWPPVGLCPGICAIKNPRRLSVDFRHHQEFWKVEGHFLLFLPIIGVYFHQLEICRFALIFSLRALAAFIVVFYCVATPYSLAIPFKPLEYSVL